MVKKPRWLLAAAVALALVGAAYVFLRPPAPAAAGPATGEDRAPAGPEVPRIALDRLDRPRGETGIGRRDLFEFATPPPPPTTLPPIAEPPSVLDATPPPVTAPTPPPLPPLNIKYIGTLESRKGLKVAMFLTEKKEVLTGQVGELVANRFRVVRIGIESVDIQETGSEQVRRIPLRGN
jgi:hypothetical protein